MSDGEEVRRSAGGERMVGMLVVGVGRLLWSVRSGAKRCAMSCALNSAPRAVVNVFFVVSGARRRSGLFVCLGSATTALPFAR